MKHEDQELLDTLLSIYERNGRDKARPVKVRFAERSLSSFAHMELDENGRYWKYKGWTLDTK